MATGHLNTDGLARMARRVAEEVAGPGVFADVAVEPTLDSLDRETHTFTFLVTPEAVGRPLGDIRLRLGRGLWDAMLADGEVPPPAIRLFGREGWDRLRRA